MLNYKICHRCWHEFVYGIASDKELAKQAKRLKANWSKGKCFCIHPDTGPYSAAFIEVESQPPKNCPYVLEHMVTANAK
jgi:hypothetical protein